MLVVVYLWHLNTTTLHLWPHVHFCYNDIIEHHLTSVDMACLAVLSSIWKYSEKAPNKTPCDMIFDTASNFTSGLILVHFVQLYPSFQWLSFCARDWIICSNIVGEFETDVQIACYQNKSQDRDSLKLECWMHNHDCIWWSNFIPSFHHCYCQHCTA